MGHANAVGPTSIEGSFSSFTKDPMSFTLSNTDTVVGPQKQAHVKQAYKFFGSYNSSSSGIKV